MDLHRLYLSEKGIKLNVNDGFYRRGKSYGVETKLRVAAAYIDARDKIDGLRPSINAVAKDCGVGWHFVKKVESELLGSGEVVLLEDIYKDRDCPRGPGAHTHDPIDGFVLYALYQKDTQRSLNSYVNYLFVYAGTIVLPFVVSRWFLHVFPVQGGLCKPIIVSYDKFWPANIAKAKKYLDILSQNNPRRIKYVLKREDLEREKHTQQKGVPGRCDGCYPKHSHGP